MQKPRPSVSTRTEEFTPRELPLGESAHPKRPAAPYDVNPSSERIRDALRRWLEEEL